MKKSNLKEINFEKVLPTLRSAEIISNDDTSDDEDNYTCEDCLAEVIARYGLFSPNESYYKSLEMKYPLEVKKQKP